MVICLMQSAEYLHMVQLMPCTPSQNPIICCFIKIQNRFIFLVPPHPGRPGEQTIKCVPVLFCSPDVEFCGYNQPHPSENKIQFRIQTKGTPAVDALRQGLVDLHSACEHLSTAFQTSVQMFQSKKQKSRSESEMDRTE